MPKPARQLLASIVLGLTALAAAPARAAMSVPDYLAESFAGQPAPVARSLWLTPPVRARLEAILGHPVRAPRLPYWQSGGRTTWILNEIGKEQPITIGVVIERSRVQRVDILEYRESRGDEVRYPAFLRQFSQAALRASDRLDQDIQGISGATLSVWAVTRATRAALVGAELSQASAPPAPPQPAR